MQTSIKKAETDAIFAIVPIAKLLAYEFEGIFHILIETKVNTNTGPFCRSGYSVKRIGSCNQYFENHIAIKPFGVFPPVLDDSFFNITKSYVATGFIERLPGIER